ncbi:MAG TPA: hypothetical protein PLT91_04540 [Clostridia bacterium]|nr:MAG: hypothetical protein BWX97_00999 [Firmicutes bacterium ADurb.Bin146]HOD93264.1 hypothetical protein [Clostridia bacterium]HQM39490.1 hypothetical protein [Clostridia bacterium]
MKKFIIFILIIAITFSILAGCDNKPVNIIKPDDVSRGEISEGYYINKDMGFKIQVPIDYHVATDEELDTKFNITQYVEDEEVESFITYLAFFSKKSTEETEDNSHIMISIEDASKYGYTDKDTYIEYMAYDKSNIYKNIEGAQVTLSNQTNVWLGNRKFAHRTVTLDMEGLYVIFDMYAVIKNGYFLSIMIGAYSDEDLEYLRGYLDTFVFE